DGDLEVVAALGDGGCGDEVRYRLRLVQYIGRKTVRQVVLANDDFDVNAEIIFIAENLNHASARILGGSGPIGNLHIHYDSIQIPQLAPPRLFAEDAMLFAAAFFGSATRRDFHAARNNDVLMDLLVHGHHIVVAAVVTESPDHCGVLAPNDANDAPFGTASVRNRT